MRSTGWSFGMALIAVLTKQTIASRLGIAAILLEVPADESTALSAAFLIDGSMRQSVSSCLEAVCHAQQQQQSNGFLYHSHLKYQYNESQGKSLIILFQSNLISIINHKSISKMGGCIRTCCLTESGLKCHAVISSVGIIYFLFMFAIFDKQRNFFEFHLTDPQGTKWVCFLSAMVSLLFLVIILIRLMKFNQNKAPSIKKKFSIADARELKQFKSDYNVMRAQSSRDMLEQN